MKYCLILLFVLSNICHVFYIIVSVLKTCYNDYLTTKLADASGFIFVNSCGQRG